VTNSERRVQRVRRALAPPAGVRDDIEILCDLAAAWTAIWVIPLREEIWERAAQLESDPRRNELCAPGGLHGLQWPCYDESHPGEQYLHGRLWARPVIGPLAPFSCVEQEPPVDALDHDFPIRLTTGRRLDSYNTGVQTSRYASPLRHGENPGYSLLRTVRSTASKKVKWRGWCASWGG
jgi:formate dehydrogenase major subunit